MANDFKVSVILDAMEEEDYETPTSYEQKNEVSFVCDCGRKSTLTIVEFKRYRKCIKCIAKDI